MPGAGRADGDVTPATPFEDARTLKPSNGNISRSSTTTRRFTAPNLKDRQQLGQPTPTRPLAASASPAASDNWLSSGSVRHQPVL
jgi:hypothetical protein